MNSIASSSHKSSRTGRGILCLTFDNMGRAKDIGEGGSGVPDPSHPSLAVGYPRILNLLSKLELKATFFVEAWNCLHHPKQVMELVSRGHDVSLHGWVHEKFGELTREKAEQIIYDGTAAMRTIGVDPKGFRAPGGMRGPYAEQILAGLGYEYDSSISHSLAQEFSGEMSPSSQPRRLASGLVNIPWLWSSIDVIHYFRQPGGPGTPSQLEAKWRSKLEAAKAAGETLTIVAHAYVSGTDDERLNALARFLQWAKEDRNIDIMSARELAGSFRSQDLHRGREDALIAKAGG